VKAFDNNLESMLLYRKTLLDDILAQGEIFSEDLYWTFKCLETVKEPETFVRYIEDKKSEWEDGINMTSEELCKFAETRYRHLLEAGKWKSSSSSISASAESKEKNKDDQKFLALVAAVKELAKNFSKPKESGTQDTQKSKWKFEQPETGNGTEKIVNSKTYWWCDGGVTKNHKPMYCRHKVADCRKQESMSMSQAKSAPKPSTNENKVEPKLKINNNRSTALAALDKVLQNSTNSDEEDGQDFP
jgi:hypothetical protein